MIQIKLLNVMYKDFTRIHDGENDHSYLSSTKKILGNIDPYWLENQSSERNQMSHWNGAFPCHQQYCHSLCQEMIRLHLSLPHIWIIFQIMDTAGLCIACGQFAADVQMFSPHVANTNSPVTLSSGRGFVGGCGFLSRSASECFGQQRQRFDLLFISLCHSNLLSMY